jgi:DNA-binding MarR family transcriptional regulator/GNAT superfamily N-acetyltransferase
MVAMTSEVPDHVAEIRRFNRFYTRTAGFLNETLTRSDFTLTEARVLFELGQKEQASASDLARELVLDAAYLARILKRFAAAGLLVTKADPADGRRRRLELTEAGRRAVGDLHKRADRDADRLLAPLDAPRRNALVRAMRAVEGELAGRAGEVGEIVLRPHAIGDMGWIIHRQAVLYAEEYGWDIGYEGLIADICGDFIRDFIPGKEFCWVAERDGAILGSVFLVRRDETVGKLRLLYVEPSARGSGLGKRLVTACIEGARGAGYSKLVLWTNDVLAAARSIYRHAGFRLVEEERHKSFGKDLVGQNWELDL